MTIAELKQAIEDVPDHVEVVVTIGDPHEDKGEDVTHESVEVFSWNDALDFIEIFIPKED